MTEEFRADLKDVVKRHSGEIDADDLRAAADYLETRAEKWEVL